VAFRVALTFDAEHPDRPARFGNDERLLDALEAAGVRATFFVQGRWAEAHPGLARRVAADGHLVGSHTHYHARLPLFSEAGLASDIRAAEDAILAYVGADPKPWIRGPFGAGANDPELIARLDSLGYRHVGWNVSCEDWEPAHTADEIAERVVSGSIGVGDGSVPLMHTWPDGTHDAIQSIVARLATAGASFVTVAELDNPVVGIPFDDGQ
jgi:peptidoglycan/xylan/chitin deacetylase (PgdA/CDA1 family)